MKPTDDPNKFVLFDSRDHHFKTKDCPTANGREPSFGEQMWTFQWELEDGTTLFLYGGKQSHDDFKGFLLHEELDDAADQAAENL